MNYTAVSVLGTAGENASFSHRFYYRKSRTEYFHFHGIACLCLCLSSFGYVQSQEYGRP